MRMSWLFGRKNVARAPLIVALLLLANALFLRAADPSELARLRDFAFDSFQRIEPREYSPDAPVRIIDIDEAALAAYGQWPWPRSTSRGGRQAHRKGVAAIAFDALLCRNDRRSISVSSAISQSSPIRDHQEAPDRSAGQRQALADAIKRSRS